MLFALCYYSENCSFSFHFDDPISQREFSWGVMYLTNCCISTNKQTLKSSNVSYFNLNFPVKLF